MSYGLKYTLTFREETGTASSGVLYKINIYELSYSGSPISIKGSDNPITLSYKKQDLISPIMGSELTIGIMSMTNGQYLEFSTAAPLQYYVDVLQKATGSSSYTTYWSGVNTTDCYSEPYDNAPYPINLKFNCGLGELQFRRYENSGNLVNGLESLILTISNCLSFLPYTKNVREIINIREDRTLDSYGFLEQTFLSDMGFTEIADDGELHGIKCNTLLNQILTSLNCRMYQANNLWYIERIWERTQASITYFDYTPYSTFQLPGTALSNIGTNTINSSVAISNSAQPKLLNGGDWAVTQKKSGLSYQYNTSSQDTVELISNPFFENSPTTKTANGMPIMWDVGSNLAPYAGTHMNIQTVNQYTNDVRYRSGLVMDKTLIAAYNTALATIETSNHTNPSDNRLLLFPTTWAMHAVRKAGDTYSNPWVYIDPVNGSLKLNFNFYVQYEITPTSANPQATANDATRLCTQGFGGTDYICSAAILFRFVDSSGNAYNLIYNPQSGGAVWFGSPTSLSASRVGATNAMDFTTLNATFPDVAYNGHATPITSQQMQSLLISNYRASTSFYVNFNASYTADVPFIAGNTPFPNGNAIYALDVYMYPPIVGDGRLAGQVNYGAVFQATQINVNAFGINTVDIQYKDSFQNVSGYTKFYTSPDIDNRWSEQTVQATYGDTLTPGYPGSFRLGLAEPTQTWHNATEGHPFGFNTSTADADPGSGKISLNNATLSSVTEIFVDDLDLFGDGISGWTGGMTSGQNIILSDYSTGGAQYTFSVTGSIITASGYYKIPVSYVAGTGTFSSGDSIIAAYQGGQILADMLFSKYAGLIANYRRAITGKILNSGGIAFANSILDEDGTLYAQTGNQFDFKKAMLTINLEEVSAAPPTITNSFTSLSDSINTQVPPTVVPFPQITGALTAKNQSLSLPVVIGNSITKYPIS